MIGRVAGRLVYKAEDHVLVDVRGVGYLVFCSDRTLRSLPQVGEATAFFTELLVREDLLQLFGFATLAEKEWHRLLMSVQGIGAKASLAILGALGPDGVSRAIALGDWSAIRAAKGIGPKTAQRVVNELKEKAPVVMAMGGQAASRDAQGFADDVSESPPAAETSAPFKTPAPSGTSASAPAGVGAQAVQAEALSALANLGYAPGEAASAVAHAMDSAPPSDTAALIRAALKRLAPTG